MGNPTWQDAGWQDRCVFMGGNGRHVAELVICQTAATCRATFGGTGPMHVKEGECKYLRVAFSERADLAPA